jgi:hypothetical protein
MNLLFVKHGGASGCVAAAALDEFKKSGAKWRQGVCSLRRCGEKLSESVFGATNGISTKTAAAAADNPSLIS